MGTTSTFSRNAAVLRGKQ